jgi:hypothetical protein
LALVAMGGAAQAGETAMRFQYQWWRMDPGKMLRLTQGKGTDGQVSGRGEWNRGRASATITVNLQPFRTELNVNERRVTVSFFGNSALVQTSRIVRLHPRSFYRHEIERSKQLFEGRKARARAVEFANQFLDEPQVVDGHAHPWARF